MRRLLVKADDAGEVYAETHDAVKGFAFVEISLEIDRGFIDIERVGSRPERLLASSARLSWELARDSLEKTLLSPTGGSSEQLDPFHDGVDKAAALLADQYALNVTKWVTRSLRFGPTNAPSSTRRSRSCSSVASSEASCRGACIGPSPSR